MVGQTTSRLAGNVLLLCFAAMMGYLVLASRRRSLLMSEEVEEAEEEHRPPVVAMGLTVLGLLGIGLGGELVTEGAKRLVAHLGIPTLTRSFAERRCLTDQAALDSMTPVGPLAILSVSALSSVISPGASALLNSGPHGLSELIYAFGSVNANVGSAFSGLGSNTNYYNVALALGMFVGRFLFVIPVLALAGSLVRKPRVEANAGTFPTDAVLFGAWLMGVLLVVGALTFFPTLSLGPVVEHLRMAAGRLT